MGKSLSESSFSRSFSAAALSIDVILEFAWASCVPSAKALPVSALRLASHWVFLISSSAFFSFQLLFLGFKILVGLFESFSLFIDSFFFCDPCDFSAL